MYANPPQLGADGSSFGQQAGSMAASFVAKQGTTMLASAMGAGAASGPIGIVVGGLVTLLMSIFGAKAKDPVFGVIAIVPEADNQIVTVWRMLDLLNKQILDAGWGWGIKDEAKFLAEGTAFKRILDISPKGGLAIISGGLPTARPQVAKINFSDLTSYTSSIAKPFVDVAELLTDDAKKKVLTEPLSYKPSKSYYYQIGESKGEAGPDFIAKSKNNKWKRAGIAQEYDAVKISGGQDLKKSMDKAWKSIPTNLNAAFIKHAGVDIMSGTVVNQALATTSFKPQTSVASILPGNAMGWLILLGGLFVLSRN